jgi:hypothetical protein
MRQNLWEHRYLPSTIIPIVLCPWQLHPTPAPTPKKRLTGIFCLFHPVLRVLRSFVDIQNYGTIIPIVLGTPPHPHPPPQKTVEGELFVFSIVLPALRVLRSLVDIQSNDS